MKSLLRFPGIILFALLLSAGSFAQFSGQAEDNPGFGIQDAAVIKESSTPVYSSGKKDIIGILELNYPKVARKFAGIFPSATNILWIKEGKDLFAYFFNHGNKVTAIFTPRGHMNYSLSYLKTADLPLDIVRKIKTDYVRYSIFDVKAVAAGMNTVYQIGLENACEYIVVLFFENEMEEIERVKKVK
jgi:hypothetical protein